MDKNSIKIFFLKKEIRRLKNKAENTDLKEIRSDLVLEAKKHIKNIVIRFDDALISDNIDGMIDELNKEINSFNDEMNIIMKNSANISSLVYIMEDVNEEDYYKRRTFIENINAEDNEYFNRFADNKYINDELLERIILLDEKIEEAYANNNKENIKNLFKERAEIYNQLSMQSYAVEDCNKAIEIDVNDINLKLLKLDILKKDNKVNADDIIKCYDDIINLDKNNLESYYKKIEYLQSLVGRQKEIINCCNEILNINSNII
ncbi:hypothetical protein [Brachyspira alvinipulli]|uniref:hypothetical protein n=1 Tax=Brachyspira alvinipulli TaxID=84379 RepID=UPI00048A30B2|nr:hypothetical protein [Brachyspira alvinipulli]